VVPAGFDPGGEIGKVPSIPLGSTSKNLDQRVAQVAHDWLASHVPIVGNRLERTRSLRVKREASRLRDQHYRETVEPAVRAISGLSRPVRRAAA
jgi:hypothetical protein